MAEKLPDWAKTPSTKGWCIQTVSEEDEWADHVADGMPGLLIGRNGQVCEIEVLHKSASRVHACIAFDEEQQPFIVDLGSTHGTFVDGQRLEKRARQQLDPGNSTVTIGRCGMTIRLVMRVATKFDDRTGGDDKKRGKAELRHKPQPATADYNKPLRHSLEVKQARKQPERPDRRHLSDSLGIEGRGGEREQQSREDKYQQQGSGRGSGRGRDRGEFNSSRGRAQHECGGPGRGYGTAGPRREDLSDWEAKNISRRGAEQQPRAGLYREREHDASRRSEQRGRGSRPMGRHDGRQDERPPRQPDRHHESSRGKQEEVHRKRQSSDDEDRAPDERRQRQRKTGFDGGAGKGPAEQPSQTPAQIVRSMMGTAGPQAPMTLEQKKKLLWGKKPDPEEPASQETFGANRWDTAEFDNAGDKNKFIKLMGVKADPGSLRANPALNRPHSPTKREALTKDKQERLLHDVEQHFMTGLRRADGRTVGLGL